MSINRKRRTRYYSWGNKVGSPDWSEEGIKTLTNWNTQQVGAGTVLADNENQLYSGINNNNSTDAERLINILNPKGNSSTIGNLAINTVGKGLQLAGELTGKTALRTAGNVIPVATTIDQILSGLKHGIINNNQIDKDLMKYANPDDTIYRDPGAAGLSGTDLTQWSKDFSALFSKDASWNNLLGVLVPYAGGAVSSGVESARNRRQAIANKAEYEATERNAKVNAQMPKAIADLKELNNASRYQKTFFADGGIIGEKKTPMVSVEPGKQPMMVTNHDKTYDYMKDGDKWYYAKKGTTTWNPINEKGRVNMEAFINGKPDVYKINNTRYAINKKQPILYNGNNATSIKGVTIKPQSSKQPIKYDGSNATELSGVTIKPERNSNLTMPDFLKSPTRKNISGVLPKVYPAPYGSKKEVSITTSMTPYFNKYNSRLKGRYLSDDELSELKHYVDNGDDNKRRYIESLKSKIGQQDILRMPNIKALGGELSNIPDKNAIPIDENAELVTNNQGGTSGSHEQGDNIPVYNQGGANEMVEPGEVIVEMPDGTQVALSKRLGMAQKYLSLSEQKTKLEKELASNTSTDKKGSIKRAINSLQSDMMSLPKEQEDLKLMYGLQNKEGVSAYGNFNLNSVNDGGETPEERRARRKRENMTIQQMEAEDLSNNMVSMTEKYPDLNLPDSWGNLENAYGVAGADVLGNKGFKAGAGRGRSYTPGTRYIQTGSATDKDGYGLKVKGIDETDGKWINTQMPGESRESYIARVAEVPVDEQKNKLGIKNIDFSKIENLLPFIENIQNANDIKKLPAPWKPIMHTPSLINEHVNVAPYINSIEEQSQNTKGSLRRNATSLHDIIPAVSQVGQTANDAVSKVNDAANTQISQYRNMNQRITDNAALTNEERMADYNNRIQAAKEQVLSLKSANRANASDKMINIIANNRLDKYQQQQLLLNMATYDNNAFIKAMDLGAFDKMNVIDQTTLDRFVKDLKDENGNVKSGSKDAYESWKAYATRNKLVMR